MHKSQANRAVIDARSSTAPRINRASTLLIPTPGQRMSFVGKSRKSPRMTSTQVNSIGRVSEWNRSPYAPKGGWR